MAKIDTSNWKKFKITDLFTPVLTDGNNRPQLMKHGSIPLVVSQDKNNGILDYFKSDTKIFPAKSITLDMFGHAFAQNKPYQTVSHGRVNVLLPKFKQSFYVSLFLASVITKQCSTGFDYKQMISLSKTKRLTIKLPVDSQGQPDWKYMNEYITKKQQDALNKIASLKQVKLRKHTIDISNWREFKIPDIFTIQKGISIKKRDMINGNTPYISATANNNGILEYVESNLPKFSAGLITVANNGSVGSSFYQSKPFYASSDCSVLTPKIKGLSANTMLFLARCIQNSSVNYSYNNKWGLNDVKRTYIKLPITFQGKPDWKYMNDCIANKRQQAKARLKTLQNI